MKIFNDYATAMDNAGVGLEVYRMETGSYAVMTVDEADELTAAGINLEPTEDNDDNLDMGAEDDIDPEWIDESMDGDHQTALESVYGPDDNYDIDRYDSDLWNEY